MSTLTEPNARTANRHARERAMPRPLPRPSVNVNDLERWLSVAGGAALGLVGLHRRTVGGLALASAGAALVYRGLSGHCDVYQGLGISTAGERHGRATSVPAGRGVRVDESFTINRPAEALYRFWRDFENLGRFMRHLESVRVTGPKHSHWVARGPFGTTVEWDAELINERQNELIAWRSIEGSTVATAGSVHFVPASGGRGTVIRVELKYDPPVGEVLALVAKAFGNAPEWTIREDLRRFKQRMETGQITAIEGQPGGTGV